MYLSTVTHNTYANPLYVKTYFSHFPLFFWPPLSLCVQMSDIVEASQSSTRELQEQIDIYKEKNRRELTELQRLLKERGQELDKYLLATKTLQEEVQRALNADTAFMVRVVKSRPSLVRPTEPPMQNST